MRLVCGGEWPSKGGDWRRREEDDLKVAKFFGEDDNIKNRKPAVDDDDRSPADDRKENIDDTHGLDRNRYGAHVFELGLFILSLHIGDEDWTLLGNDFWGKMRKKQQTIRFGLVY
ncbi:hypothetical protein L1987_59394 [Smallanthus sonchifolius]|uniref:Uncharacterized protein n=1 Tax=Smallanthus sonchifolius TaxID=185202 RepID=A0ACB9D5C6_9ASTR|nr:hypothetical protein L1987_59394 [Smallanthus sonchifolius]